MIGAILQAASGCPWQINCAGVTTYTETSTYFPISPPQFDLFPFVLGLVIGAFILLLVWEYLDDKPLNKNGKLIIHGGKMYRVRLHEIELKEKEA